MVRFAALISAVALLSGLVSADGNVNARRTQPSQSPGNPAGRGSHSSGTHTVSPAKQTVARNGGASSMYRGTTTMSPPAYTPPAKYGGSTPMYGSGSAPWTGSSYNDCVNQCVAQYGSSPSPYVPTPTMNSPSSSGPTGTGAVHTVIVAPSQGVFRFVPFAVNASVGDTIKFMWGANTHTVTKSSSLSPCNATQDAPFASGTQSKGFVFTQIVNDTNPVYFHCAVPTHCSKGMFGVINPPNAFGSNASLNGMMGSMIANNPSISAYSSMISNMTNSKDNRTAMAAKWGGGLNMAALPSWSHAMVAENVYYTRNFLVANPDMMKQDGTVDLSASNQNPMRIPMDLSAAINQANAVPSTSSVSSSATAAATASLVTSSTTTSPTASSTSGTTKASNGAIGASPKTVVGLLSVAATFLLVL
jgi:plastocyanin